jgi:hypothetical protein
MNPVMNKSSKEDIKKIVSITIGTIVLVVGFTVLIRLGRIMIFDCKEMGL